MNALALDFFGSSNICSVGYDIFPISWERVERIVDLHENMSPLVGDVTIIYSNSAEDVERFKTMQARLKSNLLNDEYVKEIAVKRCEEAGRFCSMLNQNHSASELRKIAGFIIMTLADAVAVYNHDYYHFGLKKQFEVSEHKSQVVNKIDAPWLAALYEEISSTFNKIYVCCETGNYILAFLSAVCLQYELDEAQEAGCPVYELLSNFNYKELSELFETTRRIESDFVKFITEHGGYIKQYDSFEQFESYTSTL